MSITKGPWIMSPGIYRRIEAPESNEVIATISYTTAEKANARAIAAVPEMIEALRGLLSLFGDDYNGRIAPIVFAVGALAKATGEGG